MLANNYLEWLALVKDFIDVDDMSDTRVGTCLALAQIRLNKELESQWLEKNAVITVVTGGDPLPIIPVVPDYGRVRLVVASGNLVPLDALAFNEYQKLVAASVSGAGTVSSGSGLPLTYAIEGQALYVFPYATAGSTLTLYYYQSVEDLSPTVDENIFSQYHADALLFAACLELSKFVIEDERLAMWEKGYMDALKSSEADMKGAKLGSTPLKRQITLFRGTSS